MYILCLIKPSFFHCLKYEEGQPKQTLGYENSMEMLIKDEAGRLKHTPYEEATTPT